jgi:hypothetical protein
MSFKDELRALVMESEAKDLKIFKEGVTDYMELLPLYLRERAAKGDTSHSTQQCCYMKDGNRLTNTYSFELSRNWLLSFFCSNESYMGSKAKFLYEELKKLELPVKIVIDDHNYYSTLYFKLEW